MQGWQLLIATLMLGCAPAPIRQQPSVVESVTAAPPQTAPDWNGSRVVFASAEEARILLGTSDEFTRQMGDFDRSVRAGTERTLTEREFLEYAASQAGEWPLEALPSWQEAVLSIAEAVRGLNLQLPSSVLLIVSSGKEELGAPYTRGNAIVIPRAIALQTKDPFGLIAHEMFHVASRHKPQIRDPLFALLGFRRVPQVSYPAEIGQRRITNPDAVTFEHSITVKRKADGVLLDAVALFYSKKPLAEAISAGLMASLALELVLLPKAGSEASPKIIPVATTDYLERASVNTEYAIHPEETMADNFSLLLKRRSQRQAEASQPAVLDKIETALKGKSAQ